jgi:hypothetical protein
MHSHINGRERWSSRLILMAILVSDELLGYGHAFSTIVRLGSTVDSSSVSVSLLGPGSGQRTPITTSCYSSSSVVCHQMVPPHKLSAAEKERLLLEEVGLTAFIVAEMEHFVHQTMVDFDQKVRYETKWIMPDHEKVREGWMNATTGEIINQEYQDAVARFHQLGIVTNVDQGGSNSSSDGGGALAVELICNTTQIAFQDGFRQPGLLSALGSAIIFFRNYYRTPTLIAACERVGLSDYEVAHHITDMYHHRYFRGTYTKTLLPSGKGEIAARRAVGIDPIDGSSKSTTGKFKNSTENEDPSATAQQQVDAHENDECLLWSPTTPGLCLHWKSDNEAWRTKRFERIQMEGTRDPRRGGSGTTR